jgi:hypothetical protein
MPIDADAEGQQTRYDKALKKYDDRPEKQNWCELSNYLCSITHLNAVDICFPCDRSSYENEQGNWHEEAAEAQHPTNEEESVDAT